MQLDFWNNPLVVSAFRVKYRRGGLYGSIVSYILLLACVGLALQYYNDRIGGRWQWKFYVGITCLQFLVSAAIANASTSSSMRNEVTNRTLDFQRIAALSPRQILLGKLLGESAAAYLSAIATFPLAFWCFLEGAVPFYILLLVYLNLFTTIMLLGVLGLQNRLDSSTNRYAGDPMGFAALLTPIPALATVIAENYWARPLPFFGVTVPWLLAMPGIQLGLAGMYFYSMVRRLMNPLYPALGKPAALLTLLLLDGLLAAVLYGATSFPKRIALFTLVHLVLCAWLCLITTAWRETLLSWIWRYRGRRPRGVDLLIGDRSENTLLLVGFILIGAAVLAGGVFWPALALEGPDELVKKIPLAAVSYGSVALMILAWGTLHQLAVLLAGRNGTGVVFLLMILAIPLPHLLGYYAQMALPQYPILEQVKLLSPSAHYVRWFDTPDDPLNPLPLLGAYGLLFAWALLILRRRMTQVTHKVDRILQGMGVVKRA